jgi:hypothetical protein
VLYKDSESWWMGELPDGQQGYFPANYVAEEGRNNYDFLCKICFSNDFIYFKYKMLFKRCNIIFFTVVFEARSWQGVLDITLCDKVCQ